MVDEVGDMHVSVTGAETIPVSDGRDDELNLNRSGKIDRDGDMTRDGCVCVWHGS